MRRSGIPYYMTYARSPRLCPLNRTLQSHSSAAQWLFFLHNQLLCPPPSPAWRAATSVLNLAGSNAALRSLAEDVAALGM